ncbi:MAG: hypothetical protein K2Q20_11565, partial [Phycisphaerales bacterium]|nr:hypothetical protein [Phycisphaerales bacterium]
VAVVDLAGNVRSRFFAPGTDPAAFGSSLYSLPVAGAYTARFVRIRGTLTEIQTSTFAREAQVQISLEGGPLGPVGLSPSGFTGFTGSLAVDAFMRLPQALPVATGSVRLVFNETFDDGTGPDARWDTVTVTLNDGPPPAVNLGLVEARAVGRTLPLAAGQTVWFKFEVGAAVAGPAYLDIDTVGTAIGTGSNGSNDTELALYDEDGRLVAENDDLGAPASATGYRLSLLSFGAGGGATGVAGSAASGQNGALAAGTYWLAVKGWGPDTASVGWDVPSVSTYAGQLRLNVRSNAGTAAWCAGDFNRDDVKNVADIFSFLSSWFAGCP